MSVPGTVLFVLCAVFALGTAVGTVVARNPLRAAVALLGHIVSLAGLYLVLHAQMLAAIQLLVYAGAVVVLFVFVIMLIGPSATIPSDARGMVARAAGFGLSALVTCAFAFALLSHEARPAEITACSPEDAECVQFGSVEGLGTSVYVDAVLPFELVSVLLLVAIVGAVAVARGRTAAETAAARARKAQESTAVPAEALSADAATRPAP